MLFFSFKNNVSDKMGKWAEGRSTGRKIENGAPKKCFGKNVSKKLFLVFLDYLSTVEKNELNGMVI